jgi:hypothetical protein
VFCLSKKVERELVSFNDPIVINGHRYELDVLVFNAASIKIHLDNAIKEELIGCLQFPTPASFFLEE